ncbi:hypothetical protein [Amphritea sp.]|uniref:hypothetical protein n=1 Tax=Amphritea sp. TaxID=1872502 RepID=UPI003D0A9FAF
MYKVSELQNIDLPNDGLECSVKGKFYYRISDHGESGNNYVNCYVDDLSDNSSSKLFLSDEVGETVIDGDETFGMMVGGEFAYYDIDVELECVIKKTPQGLICATVEKLKLEKDGDSQVFSF